ncbi:hypothetical protein HRH25_08315, partial [Flavisolibacter sp. BT320]|nr:hypothetical protein [Flavisolibacter longurius]
MRTSNRCYQNSKWRTAITGGVKAFLTLFFLIFLATKSTAQINIDGDPSDWCNTLATQPIKAYVPDPRGNGVLDNQFTQGSKDFMPAGELRWEIGQTKAKNDIANAAATLIGCTLYFAGDRTSNNGDAQIGFWFYLNGTGPVTQPDGTKNFAPEHSIGDLLILADFTGGGRNATVTVYRWVGTGGNVAGSNGTLATTNIVGEVAENNSIVYPVPSCFSNFPAANYDINTFYEGKIDLCSLNLTNLCFSSFLLEARSSQEITASLDDFVAGSFNAKPQQPTVEGATRCGAGSVTLNADCSGAGVRWYTAPSGGSPVFTGASYTTEVTETKTFYVTCFNTIGNSICESDRVPVTATVNANPTANAGPDQAKCQTAPSGPTSFTLAGTAANGTTSWSQTASTGTASATIATPGSLTSGVSVSGIGTVTLTLTTTSENCGTATDVVVLTVNANPTANAGPDQAKCQTAPSGPTSFTLAGTAANGTTSWSQ